ncbi:extracellular solute-binding protein [Microbacterium sp. LRZ72]|uniref:ABC transporter substrate-binding protein n=1 Tax=Microbacterium sp. LRZ72 TaxID=2942481 RepID=UPI0029B6C1E8|nr:extracellular solute-binding protein [Microbacterium sp. LRZ72]MDX2376371.1 extracellular solute-binding protein [Microbacterium sp. LRZ72]
MDGPLRASAPEPAAPSHRPGRQRVAVVAGTVHRGAMPRYEKEAEGEKHMSTKNVSKGALLAVGALVLAGCSGSGDGSGGSADGGPNWEPLAVTDEAQAEMQELYDAALESGETTVMLYAGHHDEFIPVYEAFEEDFPGMEIDTATYVGAELAATLEAEAETGQHEVSVVSNPNADRYADFAAPYVPATFEINPDLEDRIATDQVLGEGDLYTAAWALMFNMSYNTDLIDEDEMPETWADLAEAEWDDRITFMNPITPGGVQTIVSQLLLGDVLTEDDVRAIAANGRAVASDQLALQSISSGEYPVQPFSAVTSILLAAENGAPVESYFPDENNVIATEKWMLVKDAPSPDAGKLFLNYLHTKQTQEIVMEAGNFPVNQDPDLESPYGYPALQDLNFLPLVPQSELAPAIVGNAEFFESVFGD